MTNRGTGAGGANTNKNGLSYELLTELDSEYEKVSTTKYKNTYGIRFRVDKNELFTVTKQANLFKFMGEYVNKGISRAHGCKNPDECFIHERSKTMFIIEKKFQTMSGSVCEKIQTGLFKRHHYSDIFPDYNIHYIYCLSDWFNVNCKAELEYLVKEKIPVFWGSSLTYKEDIIVFILQNCK